MKLLVSLCNKESAPGLADPGVYLYLVDTESCAVTPVPTAHPDLRPANGMTGLCFHDGDVIAVRQVRPNQLVRLHPRTLAVQDVWSLEQSAAGHSLLSHGGALYLVATGLDSLLRVTPPRAPTAAARGRLTPPDGGPQEDVVWRHGDGTADTIHCNSVLRHQGRLHVSGFGPRTGTLWSTAEEGFVLDVETGRVAVPSIYHPHSATDVEGLLHWCESSRSSVCNALGQRLVVPEGYCRGLHMTAERLHVGCSTGRKKSESTGQVIHATEGRGPRFAGACQVHVFERDRRDLSRCRLLRSIDLSAVGSEIYDLLPVG